MLHKTTVWICKLKRGFFCILICAFLVSLFSGCLVDLSQAEVPSTTEKETAASEPVSSDTASEPVSSDAASEPVSSETGTEETSSGGLPGIPDAIELNGHYYKIYLDDLDWDEARQECIKLGGHLATITDEEEQKFIEGLNSGKKDLWIGGFLDTENYEWRWVTEEAFDYTNWGEGEPNNSSNVKSNETKIAVWPYSWNDLNPTSWEQSGYICEWDSFADILAEASGNS